VPAGNFAKAAFVGAKTVNGPALCNTATKSAAFTAATNVVWSFELIATSTTVVWADTEKAEINKVIIPAINFIFIVLVFKFLI
jgi:hypothetical protein